MKKITLLFAVTISLFSFAQHNDLKDKYAEFQLNGKTLFMGKYELSNGEYFDFIKDIVAKGEGDLLTTARIFSENWRDVLENPQVYEDHYFGTDNYSNYPVVNITNEGAALYCSWLSEKLSEELGEKITVRLPTKEEWLFAAKAGQEDAIYAWNSNNTENKKGYLNGNFIDEDSEIRTIITPVNSYKPNDFGIYNMSGNVAEMINEPNISMGGSWNTEKENITLVKSETKFEKADPFTGFRVILEIK